MELDLFDWKICSSCLIKKKIEEFGKNKSQRDGLHYYCRGCVKDKSKQNTSKYTGYQKQWKEKNKESVKEYQKKYKRDNREKINEYARNRPLDKKRKANCSEKKKQWEKLRRQTEGHKEKRSLYYKKKYQEDIQFQMKKKFESKLNSLLERTDVTVESIGLIGCTIPEYKAYLEAKFSPTMSWENYGKKWQIDRIIPFCAYDLTDETQKKSCFHYTNSQPLFTITTTIDSVTYIGNLNKNKFCNQKKFAEK
jgi:hypothetical protein